MQERPALQFRQFKHFLQLRFNGRKTGGTEEETPPERGMGLSIIHILLTGFCGGPTDKLHPVIFRDQLHLKGIDKFPVTLLECPVFVQADRQGYTRSAMPGVLTVRRGANLRDSVSYSRIVTNFSQFLPGYFPCLR